MEVTVRLATAGDAATIAALVQELTDEIVRKCDIAPFDYDTAATADLCAEWIAGGHYTVLLAFVEGQPAGVATLAESHALYAGGRIGILQECFVGYGYRSLGIGRRLIERAQALGRERTWAAMELCTPPLPQFERSLAFYGQHGFKPVGGRKMRLSFLA